MDLKESELLGADAAKHWYYIAKGEALRAMIGPAPVREVLDVGAGSGVFSRLLLDRGLAESAVCVDTGYAEDRDEQHGGRPIRFVRAIPETTQDLVLLMDVLEHVPDDVALLRSYTDAMPEGARVAITVPAFQWLWSGHDVFLGHYRRYTLRGLEALVRKAGLEPMRSSYFFGALFPAAALLRMGQRLRPTGADAAPKSDLRTCPAALNKALVAFHAVERATLFPRNRLAGLSAFCLATRQQT